MLAAHRPAIARRIVHPSIVHNVRLNSINSPDNGTVRKTVSWDNVVIPDRDTILRKNETRKKEQLRMRLMPGSLSAKLASGQGIRMMPERRTTVASAQKQAQTSDTPTTSTEPNTSEPSVSTLAAPQLDIPSSQEVVKIRDYPSQKPLRVKATSPHPDATDSKTVSQSPRTTYFSGTNSLEFSGRLWVPGKASERQQEKRGKKDSATKSSRPVRPNSPRAAKPVSAEGASTTPTTRPFKSRSPRQSAPSRKRLTRMEFHEVEPDINPEDVEEVSQTLSPEYMQLMEGPAPGADRSDWMVSLITEQPPPAHPALTTPDVPINPTLDDVFGTRDEKSGLPAHIASQPHTVNPKWALRKYGGDYSNHIRRASSEVTAGRVRNVAKLIMARRPEIEITKRRNFAVIVKESRANGAQV